MTKYQSLDLDAARREEEIPEGIEVTQKGESFVLPAELPMDVFDPFFTDEFDLPGLFARVMQTSDDDSTFAILTKLLFDRPDLPRQSIAAVRESLRILFGDEQWEKFQATRPSMKDIVRLAKGLFRLYGTDLGEAFASADSSGSDGSTSKETSNASTESTPAASGDDAEPTPDSSESAA